MSQKVHILGYKLLSGLSHPVSQCLSPTDFSGKLALKPPKTFKTLSLCSRLCSGHYICSFHFRCGMRIFCNVCHRVGEAGFGCVDRTCRAVMLLLPNGLFVIDYLHRIYFQHYNSIKNNQSVIQAHGYAIYVKRGFHCFNVQVVCDPTHDSLIYLTKFETSYLPKQRRRVVDRKQGLTIKYLVHHTILYIVPTSLGQYIQSMLSLHLNVVIQQTLLSYPERLTASTGTFPRRQVR